MAALIEDRYKQPTSQVSAQAKFRHGQGQLQPCLDMTLFYMKMIDV
jgi:hypothetical protein